MPKNFSDLMRDARSLVSARRLDEATAAIQEALGARKATGSAAPHDGPTLELEAGRSHGPTSAPAKAAASIADRVAPFLSMRPRFQMPEARAAGSALEIPEGASFETHVHAGSEGSRSYRLYVPAALPAGPRPLILMLHGCTQDPVDFARGTRMNALAETRGFLVAYPEQPQSANARLCWNWFEPADQHRDRGEPAILAGIVREIASRWSVNEGAIFVAGLSAGGAMAAVMGATYPELFAGIGVHSGLPYAAATDVGSALSLMRSGKSGKGGRAAEASGGRAPRLIVFHGSGDRTVHPANGEAVAGAAPGKAEEGVAGGRSYTRLVRHDGAKAAMEYWSVEGLGHAWSGGDAAGTYADPAGPDATGEMVRFFLSDGRT